MQLTLTRDQSTSCSEACPLRARLLAYPDRYESMLAICSDLDLTPDRRVYLAIQRFLNTTQATPMGDGVGLEVGNSIYFDMPPGQFAYSTTDDTGRAMIRDLIHSGHIDVLHSYGDLARSRDRVKKHIEELERCACRLEVWVDHSKAPTNFGPDIMAGSGDVPESPSYHSDLTIAYGIRHVWRGRTTGILAQNVPIGLRGFTGLLNPRHPVASARSILRERVKVHLGRRHHPRWEMYADNRVRRVSRLRDGQRMWEFIRSNPYWGGSGLGDTADGIAEVLTDRILKTLAQRRGVCILYTHLGKVRDRTAPFNPAARAAFQRLARCQEERAVFVTTTSRLLRYLTVRDCLEWTATMHAGRLLIRLGQVRDPVAGFHDPAPDELQGLTFETPRCEQATVELPAGRPVRAEFRFANDRTLVTIPWRRLIFPDIWAE